MSRSTQQATVIRYSAGSDHSEVTASSVYAGGSAGSAVRVVPPAVVGGQAVSLLGVSGNGLSTPSLLQASWGWVQRVFPQLTSQMLLAGSPWVHW